MSSEALTWAKSVTAGSAGKKALLLTLADYAGTSHHGLWPGQKTLADITEQGERTVRRQLAEFEAAGLICRTARFREGGRGRTSDRIWLHVPYRQIQRVDMPTQCAGCGLDLTGQSGRLNGGDEEPTNRPPTTRLTGQSKHTKPATDDTTNRPPVAGEEPVVEPPDVEPAVNRALPLSDARDRVDGDHKRESVKQALLEHCDGGLVEGNMTRSERRGLDQAVAELLAVGADSHQIEERADAARMEWAEGQGKVTPRALVKHWASLRPDPSAGPEGAQQSSAPPADLAPWCETCDQPADDCTCPTAERRISYREAVVAP